MTAQGTAAPAQGPGQAPGNLASWFRSNDSIPTQNLALCFLSVVLFAIQFVFVKWRRSNNSIYIKYIVLLAYTINPLVLSYALWLANATSFSGEYLLSYVLVICTIGLSREKTMTAYSVDDNKQYMSDHIRYGFQICNLVLMGRFVYNFSYFWMTPKFNSLFLQSTRACFIICYLFICGMSFGRIYPSMMASRFEDKGSSHLENYMKTEHKKSIKYDSVSFKGYDYLVHLDDESPTISQIWSSNEGLLGGSKGQQLKELCLSFALSQLLRRRFFGVDCPEAKHQKTRDLIFNGLLINANEVYRIIEAELAFSYDSFFTNSSALHTTFGQIHVMGSILYVGIICAIGMLSIYDLFSHQHIVVLRDPHKEIRVELVSMIIKVLLVLLIIALELLQIYFSLSSDWAKVQVATDSISRKSSKPVHINVSGFIYQYSHKLRQPFGHWQNLIGQHSLIKDLHRKSLKSSSLDLMGSLVYVFQHFIGYELAFSRGISHPGLIEPDCIRLTNDVKCGIIKTLRYNKGLSNGVSSLGRNNFSASWACQQEIPTNLLIWHIATEYCDIAQSFQTAEGTASTRSCCTNQTIAREISNYCAYLMAFVPEILPGHRLNTTRCFHEVREDALFFFHGDRSLESKYRKMKFSNQQDETAFYLGIQLGKKLEVIEERWAILADLWTEMILYIAPSENAKDHIEHLANGGEFLTHLWALLTHAGILDRHHQDFVTCMEMEKTSSIEDEHSCQEVEKRSSVEDLYVDIENIEHQCQIDIDRKLAEQLHLFDEKGGEKREELHVDIKTIFTDHTCSPPNGARTSPVSVPLAAVPTAGAPYPPLTGHPPFQPPSAGPSLAGWMKNAAVSSSIQSAGVAASSMSVPPNQAVSMMKHPAITEYQSAESEQLMKRMRPSGHGIDEATYPAPTPQPSWSLYDLPKTVFCTLSQGSNVTSMDFHPSRHTLLLVGSANGEITLYEIGLHERLVSKPFEIWDMQACSAQFQSAMAKDSSMSINRVTWSPDGDLIGVAFTKHLIHLHAYPQPNETCQVLEIEAHSGGVNDIAFSWPNKQLCVVTCGDDRLIRVWDMHGQKVYSFEGHEAPVYSICPHHKETIQFIFSTSLDGKIKAWLYGNMGSRVDYDAPGKWCTTMLYSADGTRLFSCGTSKDGDSHLVEWNESEGSIKRTYSGFRKKPSGAVQGVVQFDTAQNHILAAGEDNQIKFWDVDNTNMRTCIKAEGGLPGFPRLRFNKEGNLLAVTTVDNGFKILANSDGLRSLRAFGNRPSEAFRSPYEASAMKVSGAPVVAGISPSIGRMDHLVRNSPAKPSPMLNGGDPASRSIDIKPRISEEKPDKVKPWELMEVLNPQQFRVATMPETPDQASKVVRLLYTNSGVGLLALGSNAIQRLWKWNRTEQNPSGKATASVVPQHWQPNSGLVMANDTSEANPEESVPCIALSKNDSCVMSACGGKVSLFNMMTFKVMTTFMPPPPASTFLAFHPQDNNIIAIGMEDSTIHIYNVRVDEVKTKLKGHQKRVTGLAFSHSLHILVSSGADAQLCVWANDTWEKKKTVAIQMPAGKTPSGDTRVQFNSDQSRLLVVHETQLAIYDASKMERIYQWIPQGTLSAPISHASYSCNSQLVFAAFTDGNVAIFDADNLRLRCRIASSAYMSSTAINSNPPIYPFVVAAHPQEPNQFAVGLSDGSVKVMEPLESDGKWGTPAPVENWVANGRTPASSATSNPGADQNQR